MDLSKQFSLTDFLAYFFPGAFATFGIYLLFLLTPAQEVVSNIPLDFTTGIAFLVLSYIAGVILSGFSGGLVKQIEKVTKYKNPHDVIPDDLFPDEIIKRYKEIMSIDKAEKVQWTRIHYRLCRSFVMQTMPAIGQRVERHANLGLFRRNLVVPLGIWALTGIYWGSSNIYQGFMSWGIVIIILSIVFSWLFIRMTIRRMQNSNAVEVREALLGFLIGCRLGLLSHSGKSSLPK